MDERATRRTRVGAVTQQHEPLQRLPNRLPGGPLQTICLLDATFCFIQSVFGYDAEVVEGDIRIQRTGAVKYEFEFM